MSCKNCLNSQSNGGNCVELISSNGHTTWYTPIFSEDPEKFWDGAIAPKVNENGSVECNGWNPAKSVM